MRYFMTIVTLVLCGMLVGACVRANPPTPKSPALEPPASDSTAGPLSDSTLEERAGMFVRLMAEAKYEDAVKMMDSKMAGVLPADKLREIWDALVAQVGPFQSIGGSRVTAESGYKVVYVTCGFKDATVDTKVVLDKAGKVAGLWFRPPRSSGGASGLPAGDYRPPAYARTDTFTEVDCVVGEGKWKLPGTLTMPKGKGPFRAAVLVHGSGPHDRDETIGPHKVFKDLAWGLASKGIAVLRYEKRTRQYAHEVSAHLDGFTVNQETVEDAVTAVACLQRAKGIAPDKVFVLGHSLGASLAPRIAATVGANSANVAGLVLMAANARSILDLIVEQSEYLASLDGKVDEREAAELQKLRAEVARIREGRLRDGEVVFGGPKSYWEDLLAYDPVGTAETLSLPILILQGERDYQVTMEDFRIWKEALAGRDNVTAKSFPALNHLFVPGEGASSPDEYQRPGNVDPAVVDAISLWIKSQ